MKNNFQKNKLSNKFYMNQLFFRQFPHTFSNKSGGPLYMHHVFYIQITFYVSKVMLLAGVLHIYLELLAIIAVAACCSSTIYLYVLPSAKVALHHVIFVDP